MRSPCSPLVLLVLAGWVPAKAQVVETAKGLVEFVGLEARTPDAVLKELGYTSRDQLHACAADLKKAGFPDAAVFAYRENGRLYTVVSVVEPQGADRVQYRLAPTASLRPPGEWYDLLQVVDNKEFVNGILDYGRTLERAANVEPLLSSTERWWQILSRRRATLDYEEALRRLLGDADPRNRVASAMILANFPERDEVWGALAEAVRDPVELVRLTARQVLLTLTRYVPRTVNWTGAAKSLRAILNGTNLFALPAMLDALLRTSVSPSLAVALFGQGGGRMVLAYLGAQHERERTLAHDLLVRMSGQDFGFDATAWSAWVKRVG